MRKDSDFISRLPKTIKYGILVHYLFDDVFYNFRLFFNPIQNKDSKFLYDVSFGLKPRYFSKNEDECIIYDEEEQILEMYFIMSGTVGIGYQLFMQPLEKSRVHLTYYLGVDSYIGDYYLCHDKKSEFVHKATSDVEAFSLSKKFLLGSVFPKYPAIFNDIRGKAKQRYLTTIRPKIMTHKNSHIDVINRRSTYNQINIKPKPVSEFN